MTREEIETFLQGAGVALFDRGGEAGAYAYTDELAPALARASRSGRLEMHSVLEGYRDGVASIPPEERKTDVLAVLNDLVEVARSCIDTWPPKTVDGGWTLADERSARESREAEYQETIDTLRAELARVEREAAKAQAAVAEGRALLRCARLARLNHESGGRPISTDTATDLSVAESALTDWQTADAPGRDLLDGLPAKTVEAAILFAVSWCATRRPPVDEVDNDVVDACRRAYLARKGRLP